MQDRNYDNLIKVGTCILNNPVYRRYREAVNVEFSDYEARSFGNENRAQFVD